MAAMSLRIDRRSRLPIHTQLVEQVRYLVASGALAAGERLPTVRELALSLGVNRNTVQRVYGELERAGLLETRAGRGTCVAAAGVPAEGPERRRAYRRLRTLLQEVLDLGFTPAEITAMVQVEATRIATLRAAQAEGLATSRRRFATWGRYGGLGGADEP